MDTWVLLIFASHHWKLVLSSLHLPVTYIFFFFFCLPLGGGFPLYLYPGILVVLHNDPAALEDAGFEPGALPMSHHIFKQ